MSHSVLRFYLVSLADSLVHPELIRVNYCRSLRSSQVCWGISLEDDYRLDC